MQFICSRRRCSLTRLLCLLISMAFISFAVIYSRLIIANRSDSNIGIQLLEINGVTLPWGHENGEEWRSKNISKRNSDHVAERESAYAVANSNTKVTRRLLKAIHVGVVACGGRIEEPLMMLKSVVMFAKEPIHVHVIADDLLWPKFAESLHVWQQAITWRSFSYTLYLTNFPTPEAEEWRQLFKLCASQRLFIPDLLANTDGLLYVDTDVLFLRPPEDLWSHFQHFNDSHIAGLSPESEDTATNWYLRFARHPYYKPLGVNSGVMLMNLTRMRQFRWSDYLSPILNKYRYNITWGDQDIINILFSNHSDKLYLFGCEWNFRPDHCMYVSTCRSAEQNGASVLHGSRGYFHTGRQPIFKTIYDAIKRFKLGSDLKDNLYTELRRTLSTSSNATCNLSYDIFLKQIQAYVDRSDSQVILS